ncbi:MAG TPA: HEPN domain-containing protein [Sedimentisphaerales bacterium]|nr:HEPN domain-containing protein [Sedimentisphaerales bacterium]
MTDDLRDYVRKWLFRADEDVAVIDRLMQAEPQAYASTICFHAQQAVEKYLKAVLAWKGVDFPRTHDVDFLLAECRKVIGGELDPIDLKSLTDFGVSVRYPDDFYGVQVSFYVPGYAQRRSRL